MEAMKAIVVHPYGMKAKEGKDVMFINPAHIVSILPNADGTLRIFLDKPHPVYYPTGELCVKERDVHLPLATVVVG